MKVLIVDDSDIIRKVMKTFFEDFNIEVITCNNGLLGIKKTTEENPDLIFLDINMPGMNGYDTLKVIKTMEQTKNIPVVVITSLNIQKDIDDLMSMEASRVIFKPLKKEEIMEVFEDILGNNVLLEMKVEKLFDEEKNRESVKLSGNTEHEIRVEMVKLFNRTANLRKQDIRNLLKAGDYLQLRHTIHDLRGIGSTIGYPRLTHLSEQVENMLTSPLGTFTKSELHESCWKIIFLIDKIINQH